MAGEGGGSNWNCLLNAYVIRPTSKVYRIVKCLSYMNSTRKGKGWGFQAGVLKGENKFFRCTCNTTIIQSLSDCQVAELYEFQLSGRGFEGGFCKILKELLKELMNTYLIFSTEFPFSRGLFLPDSFWPHWGSFAEGYHMFQWELVVREHNMIKENAFTYLGYKFRNRILQPHLLSVVYRNLNLKKTKLLLNA